MLLCQYRTYLTQKRSWSWTKIDVAGGRQGVDEDWNVMAERAAHNE